MWISLALGAAWEPTLERVARAVVAIRVSTPRAFDTELPGVSYATGFVVDAERGLILTNRHVVQAGPVVAEAVFQNHEEADLVAVYRDPEHDFGFFRYDPAQLEHLAVEALPLVPAAARVGLEVRVVGNDAGEKLSILAGTLARLDRNAPSYGSAYNDANTFYYQAASGTSGGSSGSPVVDVEGRVVALNAGGRRDAASSFYLPLDRIVPVLDALRAGQAVRRGTLQAVFTHEPFDELDRLGLRAATQAAVRAATPGASGMLVVRSVVPGGPAQDRLRPGDILLTVDGAAIPTFNQLATALDAAVGRHVRVEVERGGTRVIRDVPVQDLASLSPEGWIEVGGSVIHRVSLQIARAFDLPAEGLFVAGRGVWTAQAGIFEPALLRTLNGEPVPTLDALEAALVKIPEGAPVQLGWAALSDPSAHRVSAASLSWTWYPARRCTLEGVTWGCRDLAHPEGRWRPEPATVEPFAARGGALGRLAQSLVWVNFHAPVRSEGVYAEAFWGTGFVLDAARGLVVTDRDTVPVAAGEVKIVVGGAHVVPARIVLLHPVHNVAVVQYDPALLGGTPVQSVELGDAPLAVGDEVTLVGLAGGSELRAVTTTVGALRFKSAERPNPPYFLDQNVAVVGLSDLGGLGNGVLADRKGRVLGLLASFVTTEGERWTAITEGLPGDVLREAVAPVLAGAAPTWNVLGVELGEVGLAEAQMLGLPAEELRLLLAHGGSRTALYVRRRWAGPPNGLEGGDVLLRVDGLTVTHPREVELAFAQGGATVSVLRGGRVQDVEVEGRSVSGDGLRRLVYWAGLVLHETPLPVAQQQDVPTGGVYAGSQWHGSPAQGAGLGPTDRIVAVDDAATPDLDSFLAAVRGRADRSPVRVRVQSLDGRERMVTLKLDERFWPTTELVRGDEGWRVAR